jgi:tetratricopeptide (TPR) repeat protein
LKSAIPLNNYQLPITMIRQIITLLTVLIILVTTGAINMPPVMAQTQTPSITEEQLKQGDELANKAFEATQTGDFVTAEKYWTQLIEQFPTNPAIWSNRGNAKVSQNKLAEAIADFNKSMELAPNAPDPYLNRGTALEGLKRWEEAIADYNRVLEIDPNDAMAYNNRGNAKAGLGKWEDAIADYQKATELAPNFAFARANYALALYQVGKTDEAIRTLKNLARKYTMFPDVRAALTAVLWVQGNRGEAESNWVAAVGLDSRYKDLAWVQNIRRWPPNMVDALAKFLKLQ